MYFRLYFGSYRLESVMVQKVCLVNCIVPILFRQRWLGKFRVVNKLLIDCLGPRRRIDCCQHCNAIQVHGSSIVRQVALQLFWDSVGPSGTHLNCNCFTRHRTSIAIT